ncbi:hypothetical protein DFP94_104107 [Fontibacillus phaseoli]|uniref:Uncharacterized protein n=1 Tax=Fontibacillus phaseoli TaxID=1416533 RepID=A0A369BEI7_9BACL|nr:hypothetical protein [Fontibacillus phaseoli]RCX19655.1 hypothetical protein DFP94_104107 [Fontibacillus phaseoli]
MKKLSLAMLSLVFLFSFATSVFAATTGSVTSTRKDNAAKSITITGSGKYMKFTVTYSGSVGDGYGGDGVLIKKTSASTGEEIASFNVDPSSKSQSTDVWLDKNATYILQADVSIFAASDASVTASIKER